MENKHYEAKIDALEEENEKLRRDNETLLAENTVLASTKQEWIDAHAQVCRELESYRSVRFDRGSRLAS